MKFDVNIKKLMPDAVIPKYGSEFAAGADLYSCFEAVEIKPGETVVIEYSKNLEDYYVIIKDRTDGSVHSVIIMKDPEANR